MSTETFTLTSAAQLKALKSFMTDRFGKFKEAIDEADELDEDTIYTMIESFFLDDNLYKIMKQKKSTKGESKSRKSKTEKDENKPKRAQSAYMLWLNDNREKIKTEYFTDDDGNLTLEGRDKVTQVAKKAGELWKTLSNDEKSPYETKAKELKEQYHREMEAYESSSSPAPLESNSSDSDETTNNSKENTTARKKSPKKKLTAEKVPVKSSKKNASGNKKSTGKGATKNASTKKKINNSESENEAEPAPASKAVKFEKHGSESDSSDSESD